MTIRVFAVDLDATLLTTDCRISERNRRALRALQTAGVEVCVVSGRMPSSIRAALGGIDVVNLIGCYHGALIEEFATGRSILATDITPEAGESLVRIAADRGLRTITFTHDRAYGVARDDVVAAYERRTGVQVCLDEVDPRTAALSKILMYDPGVTRGGDVDVSVEEAVYDVLLDAHVPDVRFLRTRLGFVEATHVRATKANALSTLCEMLGTSSAAAAAIGDSYNDLDMLESVGLSFAVANAVETVRRAVDVVVADNDSDGVAEAVDLVLERIR